MTGFRSFGCALFATAALGTPAQASVEISANPTSNMSCSAGVCTPTDKNADLNAGDLAAMLATSDVKILTGAGAVTITVVSSFSWTSTHRLTLDARFNVSFRAPVTVAGQGGLTIVTNDGGSGGDLVFFPGSRIDFWDLGSSLVINGKSHTLVGDIATLAADVTADGSGNYALARDYDAGPDGTYDRAPVEGDVNGTVEGLGHTISNLSIAVTRPSRNKVALFASLPSGTLRDINLVNAQVGSTADSVLTGPLVGYGPGTIVQCSATGHVSALGFSTETGGLAGGAGTILRSHSDVTVQGGDGDSGGLAGFARQVSDSYATGDVTDSAAGGLLGANDGIVERSHASGHVVARSYSGGGLAAGNSGQISQSYATGAVSGWEWAGGLVGASNGIIVNSYSTGDVQGGRNARAGGLVADIVSDSASGVSFSYSTGTVHGPRQERGGFAGNVRVGAPLRKNYWDVTTSKQPSGFGKCKGEKRDCERQIVGLTDDALKAALPAGFDASVWGQHAGVNHGYPYLLANPPQ